MATSRFEKRLRKAKDAPRSVSSAELIWLLETAGFTLREGKNHKIYTHPALPRGLETIRHSRTRKTPLHAFYVRDAVRAIEDLGEVLGGGGVLGRRDS